MGALGGPMAPPGIPGGVPWDPRGASPGDPRGPVGPMGPGPWADGPQGPGAHGPIGPGCSMMTERVCAREQMSFFSTRISGLLLWVYR